MSYLQKNIGLKRFICLQINTKVFYKVIVFWMCVTRLSKVPKITSFQYICNISRKTGRMKLTFCFFFNCYLAVQWPTLGNSQEDSLTNSMLITAFVQVCLKGHRKPHNEVGSLSLAEHLAGFDWEASDSDCNALFTRPLSPSGQINIKDFLKMIVSF